MPLLGDARREELIDQLVQTISRHGLRVPAIWLLEVHRPLSFLGGQALLFSQPVLAVFWDDATVRDYALLLEERKNIDCLLERLERVPRVAPARDSERPE